jgi:restriction system protein
MNAQDYELLVRKVYNDLLSAEGVTVFHQKEYIRRSSGLPIKIDVSFEVEVAGARVLVLVECKQYGKRVDVGAVDEFFAKVQDVGAHKGIIVSTVGFQHGAEKAAEARGIALALLSDEVVSGEMVYLFKRWQSDMADVLRGNVRPWGALSDKPQGVRFNSPQDLVRAIVESLS